jgi:hypothetical protein
MPTTLLAGMAVTPTTRCYQPSAFLVRVSFKAGGRERVAEVYGVAVNEIERILRQPV